MKKIVPALLLLLSVTVHAQVISKFTWDSNPVTKAAAGPDAISVSSSATSSTAGATNNGLNPGTPTKNIDLVLPGSPYFDVPSLDITVSFRREESQASFFMRGSNFDFGMNGGSLYVNFTLNKGSETGTVAVNSGNIAIIANDNAFHNYHFKYDHSTGVGNVWVDNTIVYTYNGVAGRSLNWTNAGNAVIGTNMDATGRNIAVLDNMLIQNPAAAAPLPLQLLSFTTEAKATTILLNWNSTKEINTARFVIERSANGAQFNPIGTVAAKGAYAGNNSYAFTDSLPLSQVIYYRLRMEDADGKFTYSDVKKITAANKTTISCFPNPAVDYVNLQISNTQPASYRYLVVTLDGKTVQTAAVAVNSGTQQVKIDLTHTNQKGVLLVQLQNLTTNTQESFKIIR
jgi:hypothetical protein